MIAAALCGGDRLRVPGLLPKAKGRVSGGDCGRWSL